MDEPTTHPAPPTSIGSYRIERELAPQRTYLATTTDGRPVVLKTLDPDCLVEGQLHPSVRERLARPLSFLHHFARAPEEWRASAHASRRVEMNRMAKDAIDTRAALRELPPLIKGYLRVGAFVGDGAVIDHQFGTTDVLIVMPVSAISARYIGHFGADATRHAA